MGKSTLHVCCLTISLLTFLSTFTYGEKQDSDPNFVIGLKQKAEHGDANAQTVVGTNYYFGIDGCELDYKQAVYWYKKAAELGFAEAQYRLAHCFYNGYGVERDFKQAVYWCRKAVEQRYTLAQYSLGQCYFHGTGVEQDYKQAVSWYHKAAEQGNGLAQSALGACYYNGYGDSVDYERAVYWFTKAAEQGDPTAQHALGTCYANGRGVIEDYVEAYKWFLLAGMNGEDVFVRKVALQEKMSPLEIREAQQRAKEFIEQHKGNKKSAEKNRLTDIMPTLKATGTAFCIHPDGYFVTAAHVVQGASSLKIRTEKGIVPAKIISADEGLDIALLKAAGDGFTAIPLASSSAVKTGEKVFTIGFPNIEVQGSDAKFTEGVISSLSGMENNPRFFQISVAVQPGNSGGPLVDEKGRVIGIVNAKLDDIAALVVTGSVPQNVNYAVKSSFVLPLLEGVEGLKEMPKPAELSREEAIQKAKSAVGLVLCY